MSERRLRIGFPQGSLQAMTVSLFEKAGYRIGFSGRSYVPRIDDPELEGLLLRAQEMAIYVSAGVLDVGITGADWIAEQGREVVEICELVYSKAEFRPARWVIAVPNDSPVQRPEDLRGKRVATELVDVAQRYFRDHGIEVEVEFSWGATEAKLPDLADAIVELTETGTSLAANGLRVVDTVYESTTRLIANPEAWQDAWKREKAENLSLLLQGALTARDKVGLRMNVARDKLDAVVDILPSLHTPTIANLTDPDWVDLDVVLDEKIARELIPRLRRAGAQGIVEYPLNKVIL